MKRIVIMFSMMIFSISLFSQNALDKSKSNDILKIDTGFTWHYNLPPLSHLPNYSIHSFPIKVEKIRKSQDPRDLIFPGASKYYAIWPVERSAYDKSFVIKPDTTDKYFLIVKNPLQSIIKK
jgi:hypothetical protein